MLAQIQRIFAFFLLLLFLQAVLPNAVFSADTGVKSQASQGANPLAEEEDEHGDENLKFLCVWQDFELTIAHFPVTAGSHLMPPGHIFEIPTPPPLA